MVEGDTILQIIRLWILLFDQLLTPRLDGAVVSRADEVEYTTKPGRHCHHVVVHTCRGFGRAEYSGCVATEVPRDCCRHRGLRTTNDSAMDDVRGASGLEVLNHQPDGLTEFAAIDALLAICIIGQRREVIFTFEPNLLIGFWIGNEFARGVFVEIIFPMNQIAVEGKGIEDGFVHSISPVGIGLS
ncbi:hypothetical protein [Salmonella phage GG32]|uniref:Uncharacterized protein n=1 Tax=Salmonella phage GG32 TaxID=1868169 RepID=A0A193GXM2_9CAUD|nr:hypothetical protein BI169_gp197 [Salmonella phage GG32]ANN85862.1 hypothetical protein [Salmonella phage GG32]